MRNRFALTAVLSISLGFLSGPANAQPGVTHQASKDSAIPAITSYPRLPLAFERILIGAGGGGNDRYIARGEGYTIGIEDAKATVSITAGGTPKAVSLQFAGAHPAHAVSGGELPGKVNYIRGNDPKKWQLGLQTYGRITYPETYPGIDVVYYGNQQQLEFDLVVKPGADPGAIRLKVAGADKLSLDGSGALNFGAAANGLRVALPRIYQEVDGARKSIAGRFAIVAPDEVAFRVDHWDRSRALVIDPTIVYSTVFGGGLGSTTAYALKLDGSGNILIAGATSSGDFPTVNPAQAAFTGTQDVFISKFNPTGTALIYSTYLGGSGSASARALAVDPTTSAAWITGSTSSSDFPMLNATQATYGGSNDAFVAKLSAAGVLQFSTYLGGSSNDGGNGVAVDPAGNGYVTGLTQGTFPTTSGVLQTTNQLVDAFVTKFSSAGAIVYSTLLGGSGSDGGNAIAVDSGGNAYVTGATNSKSFTGAPAGGAQPANNGGTTAFVAKLNPSATALVYFTFFGGINSENGKAIAVDTLGNAYIGGQASSSGLATAGAFQTSPALPAGALANYPSNAGFVAKLNPSGSAFSYVTYLDGSRGENITGLAIDGAGNAYITGSTSSADFPTASPVQPNLPGNGTSLFNSTNSGASWSALDTGVLGAVLDVSFNPTGASAVVVTENGVFRTVNSGASWQQSLASAFSSGITYFARSPVAPSTVYVTNGGGGYVYTNDAINGGSIFGTNGLGQVKGILADPLSATTVYFFGNTSPYVFKSTDQGLTWAAAATGLPAGLPISSIVATTDGALYAGTSNTGAQGSGIYKSTNQGGTWTQVFGVPTPYRTSLSASGNTVYLANGNVYTTTNGGASWTNVTFSGAPLIGLAVSPQNPSVVYAFTNTNQVVVSQDGGNTWSATGVLPPLGAPYYLGEPLFVDPNNSAHVLVVGPVNQSAFAAKLNSTGSALIWSTYLGGSSTTSGNAVATDSAGNAFVAGDTYSGATTLGNGGATFPGATPGTNTRAFLTKVSDATAACSSLSLSPGSVFAPQAGGQQISFSVVAPSGCAWTASLNQSWATIVAGASGTGTGIITVQTTAIAGTASQSAVLTVGTQSVTITQAGSACTFAVDQTSYPVASAGGAVSVVLTAGTGCPWAVQNYYPPVVSVTSPAAGTGGATIGISVGANPNAKARSFGLPIGTTSINIAQAGTGQTTQTITFGAIANQALGATVPALSAAATSGLAVTFTSNTTSVCAVSSATVTLVAAGTCSITASQPGNTTYAAAPNVTQTFTVATNQTAQTITFGVPANQTLGSTVPALSATATSGLTVTFTSNTTSICTVSSVTVTLLTAGTCSITASQPGNATYAPAPSVTRTFTVSPAVATPAFFNGQVSLGGGVNYLQFPNGTPFGYYNPNFAPFMFHYDLGFLAFIDPKDGTNGAYLFDNASGHWFYTSASVFPNLYDFTLNAWLYYFPDTSRAGHYTTNPRYFVNLTTKQIFTM